MTTPDDANAGTPVPDNGATPPPQPPAYYGQPPYYGPPVPQSPPSRAAWFAIGAGSMFGVGVVGLIGLFFVLGLVYGDSDFAEESSSEEEYVYYVDQASVLEAVEGPCANMRSAAYEIHVFATPQDGAVDIRRFTLSIEGIVNAIDANDPNSDSVQWRDDWEALSADLDTFADALEKDGERAAFSSLTEDKQPTIARMSYSSEADCEVPQVIEGLDPALADYWDRT